MKTTIKMNGNEYECKVWDGYTKNTVEVGFAKVKYPNRKFFRCGFFVNYYTFIVDIRNHDNLTELVKVAFERYLIEKARIELEKKEEKSKFTLDKYIEM